MHRHGSLQQRTSLLRLDSSVVGLLSIALILCALALACATTSRPTSQPANAGTGGTAPAPGHLGRPRIHSIGDQAVLSFDKSRSLIIPIIGQDLDDPTIDVSIALMGVVPLTSGIDYIEVPPDSAHDGASSKKLIEIKPGYLKDVHSGDALVVTVTVCEKRRKVIEELAALSAEIRELKSLEDTQEFAKTTRQLALQQNRWYTAMETPMFTPGGVFVITAGKPDADVEELLTKLETNASDASVARNSLTKKLDVMQKSLEQSYQVERRPINKTLAAGTRRFILYEAGDYRRRFVATMIGTENITAFPLPEYEAQILFGPVVATNYMVVRVSIRNTDDIDRLVCSGMIRAYGRALITEPDPANGPDFTIPIEVAPQSREHVYAAVSDEKVNTSREWTFRSLEFVGALAAAAVTAFDATEDLTKGVALFTGVGIPEAKKLVPDRVSGYLSNIVNFSMPDLIKVPRKSVVGQKYLFFSNGELQGMVPDPTLIRPERSNEGEIEKRRTRGDPKVVYLAFDTLEIPFENVVAGSNDSPERRIGSLLIQLQGLEKRLKALESALAGPADAPLLGKLSNARLEEYRAVVSAATKKAADDRITADTSLTEEQKKELRELLKRWYVVLESLTPAKLRSGMIESASAGFDVVRLNIRELESMRVGVLGGTPGDLYVDRLAELETSVGRTAKTLAAFEAAAASLASDDFLADWKSVHADPAATDKKELLSSLLNHLQPSNIALRNASKDIDVPWLDRK